MDFSEPHESERFYCGEPALAPSAFWRRDSGGGLAALFEGRRSYFTYNTRVAIHAGCQILGLKSGDEVLAPAYNCGSELDPLHALGLKIRLYPVSSDLLAHPDRIEPLITKKTRAIYVTHYFGVLQPYMQLLREMCDRHELRLIEDCALSLLSGANPVEGHHGDISVFCFHKFVPTPEGGVLLVNAEDINVSNPVPNPPHRKKIAKATLRFAIQTLLGAPRFDLMMRKRRARRSIQLTEQSGDEPLPDIPRHYYFDSSLAGRRIDGVTAAAIKSISAPDVIAKRRENWTRLARNLEGIDGVELVVHELADTTCPQNLPVYVRNRDQIAAALQAQGISATPWWAGYNRKLDWADQNEAIRLKETILGLPIHQALTPSHLDYITTALVRVLRDLA